MAAPKFGEPGWAPDDSGRNRTVTRPPHGPAEVDDRGGVYNRGAWDPRTDTGTVAPAVPTTQEQLARLRSGDAAAAPKISLPKLSLFDVLRELIEHSTLGGAHKARLANHVDVLDPASDVTEPDAALEVTETPEQELARLRAELADAKAGR